jgi:signal transduction histidine kinase
MQERATEQQGAAGQRQASAGLKRPRFGLPSRLLLLTILFVMLAEVLIYVPSVANFRRSWLNDKLAAAQVAALVVEGAARSDGEENMLPDGLEKRLLDGIGVEAIAVRVGGARRLLSRDGMPPEVARTVDMREANWATLISDAMAVLVNPVSRPVRVIDSGMGGSEFVEIIIDERPLRAAMLNFSVNILLLSLVISGLTAGLVYLALHRLIVRPVRRFAANVMSFEENPEDPERIIRPSGRSDEIGEAEEALSRMQDTLAGQLRQKQHLAALGLAVAKVSHDLRNMLASAQLLSDRLAETADPMVQRFAPKLIATLDRAIAFLQSTLAYGRASETAPMRRPTDLRLLAEDSAGIAGAGEAQVAALVNAVPPDLTVHVDPDQMARVLSNLIRNAVQALEQAGTKSPRVTVAAARLISDVVIDVIDNGPGVPPKAREHLFEAFRGGARAGGTGLGLAIAAELVRLHGGRIELLPSSQGASFRITLPETPPQA